MDVVKEISPDIGTLIKAESAVVDAREISKPKRVSGTSNDETQRIKVKKTVRIRIEKAARPTKAHKL